MTIESELMFQIFSSGKKVHPVIRFKPNKNGILRLYMGEHEFYCKESSSVRAYWACKSYRKTRCPSRIQTFTKDNDIKFIELKHNHE